MPRSSIVEPMPPSMSTVSQVEFSSNLFRTFLDIELKYFCNQAILAHYSRIPKVGLAQAEGACTPNCRQSPSACVRHLNHLPSYIKMTIPLSFSQPLWRFPSIIVCCVVEFVVYSPAAVAGGGAENVVVVVNDDSPTSKAIANEFVHLRQIPSSHVVYLKGRTTCRNCGCRSVSRAHFVSRFAGDRAARVVATNRLCCLLQRPAVGNQCTRGSQWQNRTARPHANRFDQRADIPLRESPGQGSRLFESEQQPVHAPSNGRAQAETN